MRNYIKIAYIRAEFAEWNDTDGSLSAAYNIDVCGEDEDDAIAQLNNIFDYHANSAPDGFSWQMANDEVQDRWIILNKDMVLRILAVATALQQITTTPPFNRTWMEFGGQAELIYGVRGLLNSNWMLTESPRDTWSHGE